jgi:hypothetical protein
MAKTPSKPPRPDKLPGPVKYKKPTGKKEDRPLEKLHRELLAKKRTQRGPKKR